jgi:nucleotide-binding universal stress UspA family protein
MKDTMNRVALIGLDLTEMDTYIISFLPTFLRIMSLEKVFFVHIARELELPEELLKKYPDLIAPLDESIENDIRSKVEPAFKGSETDFDIIVQEGSPLESFLKIAKIKNADIILMGRKKELEGSGLLSGHIVRKSPASILLIPEKHKSGVERILIPLDFSKHSGLALDLGLSIASKTNAQLSFSHVYEVPSGYYKTGKTFTEFDAIMKSHAESDFKYFCKSHNLIGDYKCEYLLAEDKPVSSLIYEHSKSTNTVLIIIGSRGRTPTSALLIGSIVEKVVFENTDIPLFVVKNKGESMSFFEALMNI